MTYLLPHGIDQSAERDPHAIAFRFRGEDLTYQELCRRSNCLAEALVRCNVGRGDRIGIYMHKCLELPVAIFGAMKAGGAYVPLDPQAPPARLRAIIDDCGIRHLVTQASKRDVMGALFASSSPLEHVIGIEIEHPQCISSMTWDAVFDSPGMSAPNTRTMENDLAYVMYTSGSTGTPKGIMHTHRSGLAFAKLASKTYGIHPGDRLSNHPPLHSDMSTFDFFAGPLAGATTVMIPEDYTKLPASLSQLVAEERLSIWYSVASALVQLSTRGVLEARDLSALRWVLFCGEPMPAKNLRLLMEALPSARFSNVYGPAEVNQCTYYHVPHPPEDDAQSIPIGREWDNTEGLILDEHDRPVADGQVGELVIRSATMMHGYWNRPQLNHDAFYRCELFTGFERTFYRCGDLVRRRADGELEFLGRKDRQIKTRGHRVELDEVEAALTSHPLVLEAAAFALPDPEIGNKIAVAVIIEADSTLPRSTLQAYLRERLPSYAVPQTIEVLASLPYTPTGKIDRRALQLRATQADDNRQ